MASGPHTTVSDKADINALKAEFKAELKSLEQRMAIKLGGMLIVGLGVLVTIDRLLGLGLLILPMRSRSWSAFLFSAF